MTVPVPPELAWATPADVKTYTGLTATEAEIMQAHLLIELFAGTTIEASNVGNVSSRNRRYLRMAVAYQTAWMQEHPDIFTAMDVTSVEGAQLRSDNAGFLAPLADRCLNRLSWRLRPWRVRRGVTAMVPPPDFGSRESAAADDDKYWSPL